MQAKEAKTNVPRTAARPCFKRLISAGFNMILFSFQKSGSGRLPFSITGK
jgi:hypothetical protein